MPIAGLFLMHESSSEKVVIKATQNYNKLISSSNFDTSQIQNNCIVNYTDKFKLKGSSLKDNKQGLRLLFRLIISASSEPNAYRKILLFSDWNFSHTTTNIIIVQALDELLNYYNAFVNAARILDITSDELKIFSFSTLEKLAGSNEKFEQVKVIFSKASERFNAFAGDYLQKLQYESSGYPEPTIKEIYDLLNVENASKNYIKVIKNLLNKKDSDKDTIGDVKAVDFRFKLQKENFLPLPDTLPEVKPLNPILSSPTSPASSTESKSEINVTQKSDSDVETNETLSPKHVEDEILINWYTRGAVGKSTTMINEQMTKYIDQIDCNDYCSGLNVWKKVSSLTRSSSSTSRATSVNSVSSTPRYTPTAQMGNALNNPGTILHAITVPTPKDTPQHKGLSGKPHESFDSSTSAPAEYASRTPSDSKSTSMELSLGTIPHTRSTSFDPAMTPTFRALTSGTPDFNENLASLTTQSGDKTLQMMLLKQQQLEMMLGQINNKLDHLEQVAEKAKVPLESKKEALVLALQETQNQIQQSLSQSVSINNGDLNIPEPGELTRSELSNTQPLPYFYQKGHEEEFNHRPLTPAEIEIQVNNALGEGKSSSSEIKNDAEIPNTTLEFAHDIEANNSQPSTPINNNSKVPNNSPDFSNQQPQSPQIKRPSPTPAKKSISVFFPSVAETDEVLSSSSSSSDNKDGASPKTPENEEDIKTRKLKRY